MISGDESSQNRKNDDTVSAGRFNDQTISQQMPCPEEYIYTQSSAKCWELPWLAAGTPQKGGPKFRPQVVEDLCSRARISARKDLPD